MIHSMTGFGKSVRQLPSKKITIEIKSLNSKSLDLNARIPSNYREKELEMRRLIADNLQRGKVDFNLYIEITGEETTTKVNQGIVREYVQQLMQVFPGQMDEEAAKVEMLKMAVRMPDALKTEKEEIDAAEFGVILEALEEALVQITAFRNQEGEALEKDFRERTATISDLLEKVKAIDPERSEAIRTRLENAVADLKENVDENRFEQELIYYLEKFDITEEKVRLANHLKYFSESLDSDDSNGKKLGFICQEIGREINTIGSKANYAPMQQLVVQMKDELEKIKEQVLNVL
ncbi:YicC/YloC family endoribonuclease [Robertkochia sediminum]|uniref:YicC/YloC family endoribonuclease n=1 Tax=Robertkochia sediminum TaxID=2785326 RepID=UPI0019321F4C|nr:YicC/YloC family endoribonuclease [Robertkochia sediminum]MBL7471873.1 YicC family protein [Robertkochia sediminum]